MRIVVAGTSQYVAFHGQAIFMLNLAEGLVQRGHEVMALVNSEKVHPYRTVMRGVQVEALRSVSLKWFHPDVFISFPATNNVQAIFRRFQPDIVHIQDQYPTGIAAVRAAKRMRIKVVGTNHFMPENIAPYIPFMSVIKPAYTWFMWTWMLSVFNRLDGAAAPSRTGVALLRSQKLKPHAVPISCGVDTRQFHPESDIARSMMRARYHIDPKKTVFFFVGRTDKEKRLDVLIRAMHALDREDLQLVIAGRGAVSEQMKSLAIELGLGNRVVFTGFVPAEDLPGLLNSVDIFAIASEAELLSIATLQAMACARPVMAARAVALPELVTDGVNGYLFTPGDVDDAARTMARLADQRERWPEMGAASLEKARFHSLDNIVEHYEKFYEAVLAGAPLPELSPMAERMFRRRQHSTIT